MKNKWIVNLFIVLFIFVFFGCNQGSRNERRLIGTWINTNDDVEWIFKSDGSVSGGYGFPGTSTYIHFENFEATDDKIILYGYTTAVISAQHGQSVTGSGEYQISNDRKTLILNLNLRNGNLSFRRK